MKKILKISGVLIGVGLLFMLIFVWVKNEPLPEGKPGPEADALARKMLKVLNHDTYNNTRYLEWSYQGGNNRYLWDKAMGKVNVRWKDNVVDLNLVKPKNSIATKNNGRVVGAEKERLIKKALDYFNNDSFWLVAPYKVFDKGTTRGIVALENDEQGLLVTYGSGGTTPGDTYLWILNENGFPNSYKMWVKIIPIGGLEATWDDWMVSESGAFLPKSHVLGPITLSMGEVKGYN
ncbi:hypothetical protein [uncultured Croceitalea sp.]|uniref:hypothetical protein n=1 Tax=uncultured Croceitalea sp. TaxID=1798908 RepID=UPI0033064B2E